MITSRQNERLKEIRRLRQCKDLRRQDPGVLRAVLEGPHLIEEALASGHLLSSLLMTEGFADSPAGRALLPRLPRHPLVVAEALLDELTDSDSPRGILAVVDLPRRRLEGLPLDAEPVYVFAEGLQDPGNVGALARAMEASGADGLCLGPGCAQAHHPRAMRASAGSLLRLPTVRATLSQLRAQLQPLHPHYLGLMPKDGAPLYGTDLSRGPLVLLLGSEGQGLSDGAQQSMDLPLTIPVAAPVESLNATVAASLVLFEIRRQRGFTG